MDAGDITAYICPECDDEFSVDDAIDGLCPWCDEPLESIL